MTGRIAQKKREKQKKLLDSAYLLFLKNGISQTTIADICQSAGIAKGTFYLYFKDKDDILRSLTKKLSMRIIEQAYTEVLKESHGFIEDAVAMASYLIHFFLDNQDLVEVLKKDFVWPISEEEFNTTDFPVLVQIRHEIEKYEKESGISQHQILIRLYAMISMICSVCYSSIIDHFPDNLAEIEVEIYTMIRQSFSVPSSQRK